MAKVKKRVQKQNARGQLRANFLKTVIALKGKQCNVLTCEDSKLQGTFEALKPRGTRVVLSDVITPANQIISSMGILSTMFVSKHTISSFYYYWRSSIVQGDN
ncbi:unnamed protein product [Leptidea sinapis]|uniref:Uncharacterized protein n=1 Tax=Leptidea sinapis TaxID=189913 RepID=A0A5E4PSJ6_9NEOP|nr:unnamed protein product [Leptidea sinapis]